MVRDVLVGQLLIDSVHETLQIRMETIGIG